MSEQEAARLCIEFGEIWEPGCKDVTLSYIGRYMNKHGLNKNETVKEMAHRMKKLNHRFAVVLRGREYVLRLHRV